MGERILMEQRRTWQDKPVLREVYQDYYRRIAQASRPGRSLEIGGGSGNLKSFLPNVSNAVWYVDISQSAALGKGPVPNAGNAIGKNHLG